MKPLLAAKRFVKWVLRQILYARLRLLPLTEARAMYWAGVMKKFPAIFAEYQFSKLVTLRSGERMRLGLIDVIERSLLVHGVWDEPITDFLEQYVLAGQTVIDIGGNIGYFTLQASRLVGVQGRVVAFEPTFVNLAKLCDHLWINQAQNVLLATFAVGNALGTPRIGFPTYNNAGAAHLRSSYSSRGHLVFLRPLDAFFNEHCIKPDLIKLDVEGYEWEALKGLRQTLLTFRPIVLCELTDEFFADIGQDSRAILAFMEALGYRCEILGTGKRDGERRGLASSEPTLPSSQIDVAFFPV